MFLSLSVGLGLCVTLAPGAVPPSWAAPAPTPSTAPASAAIPALPALLREAAERHPAVRQAKERYETARARVAGQGLRPDPMVEAGVMSLWGLMGPQVTVAQTFPLGGKLETERQMAEAEVNVAYQAYRTTLNDLLAEVKRTYYDLYFYQQASAIVERNKQLITQMSKIATARYAVGQGKQSDIIRSNTQLAEMLQEAVTVRQQRDSTHAKLLGLLNRRVAAEHMRTAEGAIPTPAVVPFKRTSAQLLEMAESRNPAILEAQAELVSGETALASARTISTPDVTARLGVGQSYMNMGWETVVSGMVGTNIPLQSRQREAAAVDAAESDLASRRSALENRRREVAVGIQQSLSNIRNLEEQMRLYTQGVLPQARQALQSELSNYQVGRSDFDAVINAQMNVYRYERAYQQAIADYHKMLADIDALTAEGNPAKETP